MFPGWLTLLRGRAWNNNHRSSVRKKAPCEHRRPWPSWASSLPFNHAATDKFTSASLTHRLTFQTWCWQENSWGREGWGAMEERRNEKKKNGKSSECLKCQTVLFTKNILLYDFNIQLNIHPCAAASSDQEADIQLSQIKQAKQK